VSFFFLFDLPAASGDKQTMILQHTADMTDPARIWTLTTGETGMNHQVAGVAQALGLAVAPKLLRPRAPWTWLPGHLTPCANRSLGRGSSPLTPPWPEIVISCGRRSVAAALWIRKQSDAFAIHIQNPLVPPRCFDLVVAPAHDHLSGENVIATEAALHHLTHDRIAAGVPELKAVLPPLSGKVVAAMIGGTDARFTLTEAHIDTLAADLRQWVEAHNLSLILTPSRRTGDALSARLRAALQHPRIWMWDGHGANPYPGMLGLADIVLATTDSFSMVGEGAFTGKPLYLYYWGKLSPRFAESYARLESQGIARRFDGGLTDWQYAPLDEMARVAAVVRERMAGRETKNRHFSPCTLF
jgi:mitochondrial fission protein ELM1